VPWNRTSLIPYASLFLHLNPLPSPACFKIHELDCTGGSGVIIRYVLSSNQHTQMQILYQCKVTCFPLACKHVLYQCTTFPETLVKFYWRYCTIPVLLSNTWSFKKPYKGNPVE
jgi:hypothetical protein